MDITIVPDREALVTAAADRFVSLAAASIARNGHFCVGLSGGSTPQPVYERLASESYARRIDWPHVYIFWGDERAVPPDHMESNYRMVHETLLAHVPLPENNCFRIPGELEPAQAAAAYEQTLRAFFGSDSAWPRFDLLLQGMGTDGHTASLFPHTDALNEHTCWVAANYVEMLDTWRITLTVPVINAAANVVFLVSGAGKTNVLRRVLYGPHQPHDLPSQLIRPTHGRLLWLADAAAGASLPR